MKTHRHQLKRESRFIDFCAMLCFVLHRRLKPCAECINAAMRRWGR